MANPFQRIAAVHCARRARLISTAELCSSRARSRGLGLLVARRPGAEGARVAIAARDEAELERACQDLAERGVLVEVFRSRSSGATSVLSRRRRRSSTMWCRGWSRSIRRSSTSRGRAVLHARASAEPRSIPRIERGRGRGLREGQAARDHATAIDAARGATTIFFCGAALIFCLPRAH
jgi:hypothetical protein